MQGGGGGTQAPSLDSSAIGKSQTTANVGAAIGSSILNNTNQVTPFGGLTYANTGGSYDYNGNFIPQYTATQTLSPGQQGLLDQRTAAQSNLFDLAKSYFPQAAAGLNTPLPKFAPLPDTTAFQDTAYKALTARSTDDINRAETAQNVKSANQGVATGSEAYNRALQPFERSRVDASNQATINAGTLADQLINRQITGNNYQLNDALTRQSAPFQLYTGILGAAGGPTMPQFTNTPQTQIQAPDVTSPQLAAFNAQQQDYQQRLAASKSGSNALMGSLFGLGGAALGGALGGPLGASLGSSLFGLGGKALGGGSGMTY